MLSVAARAILKWWVATLEKWTCLIPLTTHGNHDASCCRHGIDPEWPSSTDVSTVSEVRPASRTSIPSSATILNVINGNGWPLWIAPGSEWRPPSLIVFCMPLAATMASNASPLSSVSTRKRMNGSSSGLSTRFAILTVTRFISIRAIFVVVYCRLLLFAPVCFWLEVLRKLFL